MKKAIILLSLLCCCVLLSAQQTRLNFYSGYAFDDQVDSYHDNTNYYNGTIKGGYLWGVGAELITKMHVGIELTYFRMDTKAPLNYYLNGVKYTNFDLAVNYILLGATRYFQPQNSRIEGFAGMMLGADVLDLKNPDNNKSSTKTFFAWGAKGGLNYHASKLVSIKMQAQLISAVQSVGGGFYFGTGGSGAAISSYSTIYQFSLGGGLVFNLPGSKH